MTTLTGHDQQSYNAIFRHPISGNIEWNDILALLRHLGTVEEESNGKTLITRNGQTLTLHPSGKDAELEVVIEIRKFLQHSDVPEPHGPLREGDFLVVLDHANALIYRGEDPGSQPVHIEPYDPLGWDKHVHNPHLGAHDHTRTSHHEFFDRITKVLGGAKRILLFGDGKGSSQQVERFVEDLGRHHKDLGDLIVGPYVIDLSHLSEGEVLAKAREYFESLLAAGTFTHR